MPFRFPGLSGPGNGKVAPTLNLLKKMKYKLLISLGLLLFQQAFAQDPAKDRIRTSDFPQMRPLVSAAIPGAPRLSQPQRIDGARQDIRTEKHGLVYPALFDWNRDGKKDLLLGEFETGQTGSFIKVYLNKGSNAKPAYTGEYFYATDINGDTITNHQWCCIGIHPRLVDLDGDGFPDIVSGQYHPGLISWWRGSAKGFLPRQFIDQVDNTSRDKDHTAQEWYYSSADFADFDGDGLMDLFVGGYTPRVALNTGTKERPALGPRRDLLHVDGTPLTVSRQDKALPPAGAGKFYLTPVDWDGDGVLDILATHEYSKPGHNPIEFFRGVRTTDGLRFERPVALVTAADGGKALPGCQPMIAVTDYNNDGIPDIVFGISIPTVNGFEAVPEIAWEWVHNMGIQMPGKDAGRQIEYAGGVENVIKRIESDPERNKGFYLGRLDSYKYLTMRHRGYVFVMYGSKNSEKAVPVPAVTVAPRDEKAREEAEKPVRYKIELPQQVVPGQEYTASVIFSFFRSWHGYSDDQGNKSMGLIPTQARFVFPEGVTTGKLTAPAGPAYFGNRVVFSQTFTCPKEMAGKELPVTIHLQWQVCDDNMCLPPENVTLQQTIRCK